MKSVPFIDFTYNNTYRYIPAREGLDVISPLKVNYRCWKAISLNLDIMRAAILTVLR